MLKWDEMCRKYVHLKHCGVESHFTTVSLSGNKNSAVSWWPFKPCQCWLNQGTPLKTQIGQVNKKLQGHMFQKLNQPVCILTISLCKEITVSYKNASKIYPFSLISWNFYAVSKQSR